MSVLSCLTLASGYIACIVSNGLASLGSGCAQALQEAIPTFQLNLSRYIFQVAICGCLSIVRRENVYLEQKLMRPLLLAGVFSNVFNICYYTASALLPLGTLLVVTNVTQIVNSCILNKIIFNKTVPPLKYFLIGMMILGLGLILQPKFIFHGISIGAFGPTQTVEELGHDIYNLTSPEVGMREAQRSAKVGLIVPEVFVGAVLAVIAGIASTSRGAVYKSKFQSVSMGLVGLWVGVMGTIPSFILMFYIDAINLELSSYQIALLFGHGFGAASYSTLNIYAQQKLSPVTWAMLDNSKLVINFTLQYTILSGVLPGKMNALEVLGAVIALFAMVGSVVIDVKADKINKEKDLDDLDDS